VKDVGIFASIICLILLLPAASYASYDADCMKLLSDGVANSERFQKRRSHCASTFQRMFRMSRPFSDIECEAIADVMHELTILAKFKNGQAAVFAADKVSLERLATFLVRTQIVKVVYLPGTLLKIGETLKQACNVLGRDGCDAYDKFQGFTEKSRRPFSPKQELAIKWATFQSTPRKDLADTLRIYYQATDLDVETLQQSVEVSEKRTAREVLSIAFDPDETAQLYNHMVEPFIRAVYEKLATAVRGEQPH
jgi:hypothetical protein